MMMCNQSGSRTKSQFGKIIQDNTGWHAGCRFLPAWEVNGCKVLGFSITTETLTWCTCPIIDTVAAKAYINKSNQFLLVLVVVVVVTMAAVVLL